MQSTHTHSGEPFNEKREAENDIPLIPGYPGDEETEQRKSEEVLVHFLFEERFQEALMAVRSLDNRSHDYLNRVTEILEAPDVSREFRERALYHAKRSIRLQDGALVYLRKRLESLLEAPRKRERISEMISLLVACRHRNDLIRRRVMVSQGGDLSRAHDPKDRLS